MDYLESLREQINEYVRDVLPEHFGLSRGSYPVIESVIIADYNINFVVQMDGDRCLLRVNVEQQSGLSDQIEYEYKALKLLSDFQVAPKAYLVDNSKSRLRFGFLVEEYLSGDYLDYDEFSGTLDAARLLATLHRIPLPADNFLATWASPLEESFKDISQLFDHYKRRKKRDRRIVSLSGKLIRELEKKLGPCSNRFNSCSIVHTDVVNDNFIRSPQGLRLIDWEKPRIDDPSYDLCVFLGTPSELWSSPRAMTDEERNLFLVEYCRHMEIELSDAQEKVRIRQPFVSLHWVLWAAIRLSTIEEGSISPELIGFHSSSISRYKKVATAEHLETLLREVG